MRTTRLALAGLALSSTLALVPGLARAQDTAAAGAATALFDEGVALLAKGKLAEACPKLARSQELAPNGGTLMALGECYEKNGQIASAWVAYKDAADRANAAKKADAERAAMESARRLEAKISKLTVEVSPRSEVDGLVVKRDGRPVNKAEWNIAVPLDPGLHTFEATAPGRKAWTARVNIGQTASQKSIAVPLLDLAAGEQAGDAVTPVQDKPAEPQSSGGAQRAVGLVMGGVGLVGVGVGAFFGLQASSKNDDAAALCRTETQCTPEGLALDKEARDAATVSTISMIAGGVLLVGGLVVFATAPSKKEPTAAVAVRPTLGGASLSLGGTF
jgi:hypothetical protein